MCADHGCNEGETDDEHHEVESVPQAVPEMTDRERLLAVLIPSGVSETVLNEICPHGAGLKPNGQAYTVGYTGKEKACTLASLLSSLNVYKVADAGFEAIAANTQWTVEHSKGDDIHEVFRNHRPGSCMRYDSCKSFREVYAVNPACVRVIWLDAKKNPILDQSCSALYWIGKNRIYLDRVYGGSGTIRHAHITKILSDNLKATYGKEVYSIWELSGDDDYPKVTFRLKNHRGRMPYMDTFRWVKKYDDKHIWVTNTLSSRYIDCTLTDGTRLNTSVDSETCSNCGCAVNSEDCQSEGDEYYCESCHSDMFTMCNWTEEIVGSDDGETREIFSRSSQYRERCPNGEQPQWRTIWISQSAINDYFYETVSGNYVHTNHAIEDTNGDYHAPGDDTYAVTEDGAVYPVDEVCQIENGETHPKDDCIEIDGVWYLDGEQPETDDIDEDSEEKDDDDTADSDSQKTPYVIQFEGRTWRKLVNGETIGFNDLRGNLKGFELKYMLRSVRIGSTVNDKIDSFDYYRPLDTDGIASEQLTQTTNGDWVNS